VAGSDAISGHKGFGKDVPIAMATWTCNLLQWLSRLIELKTCGARIRGGYCNSVFGPHIVLSSLRMSAGDPKTVVEPGAEMNELLVLSNAGEPHSYLDWPEHLDVLHALPGRGNRMHLCLNAFSGD
jgi:hypothetical protein